ncbi:pyruvate kinase [Pseudodesulfovibrio sp.]|nr:pyruvate kinase [Pseudodesulfovibrio sp.]
MKKILATLGPSSWHPEIIEKIVEQDVQLLRINLSHEPLENIPDRIRMIQSCTDVPICLDSEGAQIRTCIMQDGETFYEKGSTVKFNFNDDVCTADALSFTPKGIVQGFVVGDKLSVDFDMAQFEIVEIKDDHLVAKTLHSGVVGTNKAATLFREITLNPITEKDRAAFAIGLDMGVRNFALSFAGSGEDVEAMRDIVGTDSTIISKIESLRALSNLADIIAASDELLIDRGDLSRQVPIEKIPFMQRRIISMAKLQGKPIYVATNCLESMRTNREPTRAEVNDIVSTLLMGSDGLVLAAETTIGRHPVEAVQMVRKLINSTAKWTENTSLAEIMEM